MFFMMLNSNLQIIGQPINEFSPKVVEAMVLVDFSVNIGTTPGTEDIKLFISPAIDADNDLQVYASKILKPGRKGLEKNLRHIGNLDHTFMTGGSIKDIYLAKFGVLPGTGDKVYFHVKATNIANGFTGIPMSCTAIGSI